MPRCRSPISKATRHKPSYLPVSCPVPSHEDAASAFGSIPEGAIVLIIDKDSQIIDLYRRYLSNYNLTVIALTDLSQAVVVAQGLQTVCDYARCQHAHFGNNAHW